MRRDLTTSSTDRQAAAAHTASAAPPARHSWHLGRPSFIAIAQLIGVLVIGVVLLALLYQIPATHHVDIGGYGAAYVQGFYDPELASSPDLASSDGSARWSRAVSYLLFPQIGTPAQVTLRLRGPADGAPHELVVLLNGTRELGRIQPGASWEEYSFTIDSGLLKPNDVVIELRSAVAPLHAEDPRPVGVLLDRATYSTSGWPITPYPAQLAYGALAVGMLYVLLQNRRTAETQNRVPSGQTAEHRTRVQGSGVQGSGVRKLKTQNSKLESHRSPVHPPTRSPAHCGRARSRWASRSCCSTASSRSTPIRCSGCCRRSTWRWPCCWRCAMARRWRGACQRCSTAWRSARSAPGRWRCCWPHATI